MKITRLIPLFICAALIVSSCSKKDNSTPAPTYKSPSIASHTDITVPAGLQTKADNGDYNASLAATFITMANGLSSYAADFTVPDGASKSNLKSNGTVYFWSYQGYSYWMTYTVLTDKYTWTYDWQTPSVSRFTFISAEELKNGTAGNWKIYNPETPDNVMWDFNWTLVSSVYNGTMNFYQTGEATVKFIVQDNGNNSGDFQYFVGTVKKVDVTWNSDGSGSYWFSDDGVSSTATGSWTASGK
jgi:hypothetical protein